MKMAPGGGGGGAAAIMQSGARVGADSATASAVLATIIISQLSSSRDAREPGARDDRHISA